MKISLQVFKGRFKYVEINELEDKTVEIIQSEEQKEKRMIKMKKASETCGTPESMSQYA